MPRQCGLWFKGWCRVQLVMLFRCRQREGTAGQADDCLLSCISTLCVLLYQAHQALVYLMAFALCALRFASACVEVNSYCCATLDQLC